MRSRRFTGGSIDEVLPQIRSELRDGAVILSTRRVMRAGFGGFVGREAVDVTVPPGDAAPREQAAENGASGVLLP